MAGVKRETPESLAEVTSESRETPAYSAFKLPRREPPSDTGAVVAGSSDAATTATAAALHVAQGTTPASAVPEVPVSAGSTPRGRPQRSKRPSAASLASSELSEEADEGEGRPKQSRAEKIRAKAAAAKLAAQAAVKAKAEAKAAAAAEAKAAAKAARVKDPRLAKLSKVGQHRGPCLSDAAVGGRE